MAGSGEVNYTLPPAAYEPTPEGERYPPVVPPDLEMPEFTVKAIVVGVIVGVVFGAANAYLGLKVGLTVSASIPAAVIAVAIFKALRTGTILETNLVQTIGSAGESLAAGVIFTIPVLFLWGESPGFFPIFPLALIGGLIGVLMMVPLRRFLIVKEHGKLSYPEGTACAEVQVASQAGGTHAKLLFIGMLVGAVYQSLMALVPKLTGVHLWGDSPSIPVNEGSYRTEIGAEATPELLGVGYIIGPKVAAVMLAGGAAGWLVMIPLIYLFGGYSAGPIPPEVTALIPDMSPGQVWSRYLRYIGAGAVAFGGLFTLVKSTPTMIQSFQMALAALKKGDQGDVLRTERELSIKTVGAGLLVLGLIASFAPLMQWTPEGGGDAEIGAIGLMAGMAVVVFSFFFVTVSSRIVGLLGSSSNPISGMTIATVLICAVLFGSAFEPGQAKVAVLTIGALVCIAAAISGDTSQDLKTGFLVGATPKRQQWGEIIGVVAAAIAMSTVLALFRDPIVSGEFVAPQANLIRLVIDGVLDGNLPWALVLIGVAMAFCVEIMGLPTLAFAVGLYLPMSLATPIMTGGLIRWAVEKRHRGAELNERRESGVLYASGLIAGAALIGVGGATIAFFGWGVEDAGHDAPHWIRAVLAFSVLVISLGWVALARKVDATHSS